VLPNFFLAGAPKAGTTSLYHYLAQHPQIYMSPIKEPCYFSLEFRPENCSSALRREVEETQQELRRYLAGPMPRRPFGGMVADWNDYLRLFDGARHEAAVGEASPGYLWSKTAAQHIRAKIPGAKALFILRDPAERAFSQYLHLRGTGRVRRTFREQIEANLRNRSQEFSLEFPFLEFGLYAEPLRRYIDLFPTQNLCVQFYDDYRADPGAMFAAIFRFLGVDAQFAPDTSQRHLEGRAARAPKLARWAAECPVLRAAKGLAPAAVLAGARRVLFKPREKVAMSADDRRFLAGYYADDIRETAKLTGSDLSAWLAYR
jgi:hypothetical protein